jgi:hypothetical protein
MQAAGSSNALILETDNEGSSLISFLDEYNNQTLRDRILSDNILVAQWKKEFH